MSENKPDAFFTVCKLDEINHRKYNLTITGYKKCVRKILDILLELDELKKSKIFTPEIKKIRFDIAFCNNEKIKEINAQYRNKNTETDVITFALFNDDENSIIYRKTADLGQIIISLEMTDKQKAQNNNTFINELITLTTHGILHLLGFDHLTKKDYDFVVEVQKKVLKEFNE